MRVPLWLVAFVLAGLVCVVTWPQVVQLEAGVPDLGDPLLNAWALAWIARALVHHPAALFDANIFHPESTTLAYSETLLLPGIAAAPLSWIGAPPILVHNLLVLGGYWLSGLATWLLVRRLTQHDGAALLAGAIFAVHPYRIEQYSHLQMQLAFWIPLALLALHAAVERPRWQAGFGLGGALVAQLYTGVYLGIFGAVAVAVVAAVLLGASAGRRRAVVLTLGLGALVAVTLALPLERAHREASAVVGERTVDDVARGSARPSDYQRAHPENAWHGDAAHPGEAERRLFPGWTPMALAALALTPPVALSAAYGAMGLTAGYLSLGVHAPGYRTLYDHLTPFRALRVPARLALIVGLALAVLAGLGFVRLVGHRPPAVQWLATIAALVLVTSEARMRPQQLAELPEPAPAVYTWLAAQPPAVVCEYPVGRLQGRLGPQDPTYMLYSTRHWHRLVNGYSGFEPPSYRQLLDRLGRFPDDASMAHLRALGVTWLLVHEPFYLDGRFESDVTALRQLGVSWVGSFSWRTGQRTEVFRLDPRGTSLRLIALASRDVLAVR